MPFSVRLYFDEKTEISIRELRKELADNEASMKKPHISMGGCEEDGRQLVENRLGDFVVGRNSVPVQFSALGLFPNSNRVIFLAPTVTAEILSLHQDFYHFFPQFQGWSSEHYLPKIWIPHCTLVEGASPTRAEAMVSAWFRAESLPSGRIKEISLHDLIKGIDICVASLTP